MKERITIEKVCMMAGKIMLVSGAETHRVEDTMNRIATNFGIENPQSYATPTGINFSVDVATMTNSLRISKRSTDLNKIADVNSVSRKITAGEMSITEAYEQLRVIDHEKVAYNPWVQIIAAAFASGCFTIMFGGSWPDFLPTIIAGAIGFTGMLGFERLIEIRFLAELFGSFLVGISAYVFVRAGFGLSLDMVIIGAVMPLVPGLHITNAIRDLMSGHLVSGVSKGVEALLTSFAIGAGVALIFTFV
ncbi:threonine/serine exporter family protein [Oceanobacillus massiliensis]|uniref:threonine/serine exporter family protein n=1 Tax=Oceanobacillus massiliensis TaxID=1465765 RepID=UPI000288DD70|nr:threonine/serine exporter family protein [Oceanobacillus massiliensis]